MIEFSFEIDADADPDDRRVWCNFHAKDEEAGIDVGLTLGMDEAVSLYLALEQGGLVEYVREERLREREWERLSPLERARLMGEGDAYDANDPKHPDFHERMTDS